MAFMHRKASIALPFLVLLAGCGGSSSNPRLNPNLTVSVDVTSISRNLKTYGPVTAGWNQLTGTTTVNGAAATVELLANVNYRDGSGSFDGFITLTLPDTSAITFRMNGQATFNATTNATSFYSPLTVVGGSGSYASASGQGTFIGSRTTDLGGAVHVDLQLELH